MKGGLHIFTNVNLACICPCYYNLLMFNRNHNTVYCDIIYHIDYSNHRLNETHNGMKESDQCVAQLYIQITHTHINKDYTSSWEE